MAGSTTQGVIGHMLQRAQSKYDGERKKKNYANKKRDDSMRDDTIKQEVQKVISEKLGDNRQWQEFIDKAGDSVLKSDKKLGTLLDKLNKAREATIQKAIGVVKNKFKVAGVDYNIKDKVVDGNTKDCRAELHFIPKGKANGKKAYNFKGINICFDEGNKPSIYLDDDAKEFFSSNMNEELASAIRGALIMIQDKHLSKLDSVDKAYQELYAYMDSAESKIQKMIQGMPKLDISMMKSLLKYRA